MRVFDVTTQIDGIDFAPKSKIKEILQNVRTILTTPKYSTPLDREFGLNLDMLDAPSPAVQAKLTTEIVDAIQRYEPRVKVQQVIYEADAMEGIVRPKVRVKIIGT